MAQKLDFINEAVSESKDYAADVDTGNKKERVHHNNDIYYALRNAGFKPKHPAKQRKEEKKEIKVLDNRLAEE